MKVDDSEIKESSASPLPRSHFRLGSFTPRHYKRAPISEAIINLALEMPPDFTVEKFHAFSKIAGSQYTEVGDERTMNFSASAGGIASQPAAVTGFRFLGNTGKYVVICRANSFSLSRLAPYEDWNTFRDEARRLWDLFRRDFSPTRVTGLSVRYINRIEIPWKPDEMIDFRWYFRTFPEVSSDLDVGMAGFYMRLDIPLASIGARLVLNQAMLPAASPKPESISVLLDTDIVTGLDSQDEDVIWQRCDILRRAKNDVFESCITNLARELFE